MTIQQSTSIRERDFAKQIDGNAQQVNCKGDKIENITQLLMHLGMDDIKNKCDDCNIEVRHACFAKPSQVEPVKIVADKADIGSQCAETHVFRNRLLNGKERSIESKLILSSIFASIFVVAMRF